MRRPDPNRRGFALFAVIILLALMTVAISIALDDAVSSMSELGTARASQVIKSGLDFGVDRAVDQLQNMDVSMFTAAPADQWDIFDDPWDTLDAAVPLSLGREFVPGALPYPASGPLANAFRVRVGLRQGPRAQAPAGEDVNRYYGQIVEIQVGIDAQDPALPPVEERVGIGLLIPRRLSQAN